jgi:hypothetical protein
VGLTVQRAPIALHNIRVIRLISEVALQVVGGAVKIAGVLGPIGFGLEGGRLCADLAGVDDHHGGGADRHGREKAEEEAEVELHFHDGPTPHGCVRDGGRSRQWREGIDAPSACRSLGHFSGGCGGEPSPGSQVRSPGALFQSSSGLQPLNALLLSWSPLGDSE